MAFDFADHSSFICVEHLQFSTTFSDHYKPILRGDGHYEFTFEYTELRDIIDIHKNGLKIFTYCTNPIGVLSSAINTMLLWLGGGGSSKYLPMLGSRPTNYQVQGNVDLLQSVSGTYIEERIVTKVNLPTYKMKTGDVLIARRWTGHTTEMMLISGAFANHAAIIYCDPDSSAVFVLDCFEDAWGSDGKPGVKKTLVNDWL